MHLEKGSFEWKEGGVMNMQLNTLVGDVLMYYVFLAYETYFLSSI